MHWRLMKVVIITLLILICNAALAADKVDSDPHLSKKVSLDCVNVRLHTAVELISANTGVTVRTGKSQSDWKVRDVPILVCAKDLPLGVLLRGLSDTTHLLCSQNKFDDSTTYRIWRDLRRQNELDTFEESRGRAAVAALSYDWDLLCKIKDIPESALEDKFVESDWGKSLGRHYATKGRPISKILSELGPEMKDRILAGETIILNIANAPESVKPYIIEAFEIAKKINEHSVAQNGGPAPKPLDEEAINRGYIKISVNSGRGSYPDELRTDICGSFGVNSPVDEYESLMLAYDAQYPRRPKVPEPTREFDDLSKQYSKLALSQKDGPAFLDTKVKVETPKDGKKPTYSDLLAGMSKATGYSIIAEGSAARYRGGIHGVRIAEIPTMFGKEITVREILQFSTGSDNMNWYLDEQNKLIIGRDREWTERLKALVPEKLLIDMRDKLNGKGVELDDLEPLVWLSFEQRCEWIDYCPEFPEVEALGGVVNSARIKPTRTWELYFALKPLQKTAAKSGKPVSLAGFDRIWVYSVLRQHITAGMEGLLAVPLPEGTSLSKILLADPDTLPDLWVRVDKSEPLSQHEGKHSYIIEVEGPEQGEPKAAEPLLGYFPIYSPARQAELQKMKTQ